MRESVVLKKLRSNECVLCIGCSIGGSRFSEMAGMMGFDCLWIDMEHKAIDFSDAFNTIQGARASNADCVVRIRKDGYMSFFRPLEDGAAGIMVPHCTSADEAKLAVRNAKYHPLGMRGIDMAGVDADYMLANGAEHIKWANEQTFIMVQIEDKEAVDCLEEIIAVDGIDIVFIGPGDLSQSYGGFNEESAKKVYEACIKASKLAQKYGKWWGTSVGTVEAADKYYKLGARFLNIGSDLRLLITGAKQVYKDFQKMCEL